MFVLKQSIGGLLHFEVFCGVLDIHFFGLGWGLWALVSEHGVEACSRMGLVWVYHFYLKVSFHFAERLLVGLPAWYGYGKSSLGQPGRGPAMRISRQSNFPEVLPGWRHASQEDLLQMLNHSLHHFLFHLQLSLHN